MARSRGIKPSLFKNEILGVANPLYTLLFEGLWCLADREGRLEDRPLRIRGEIFPYREGLDITGMLDWLHAEKFIQRYEAEGKKCILVLEFVKHQNPHKNEAPSELPAPMFTALEQHSEAVPNKSEQSPNKSEALGLTPDSCSLTPDSCSLSDCSEPAGIGHTLPTMAAAVCVALKASGIGGVNPSHQGLIEMLEQGADIGSFVHAGKAAVERGKGNFGYVLAMVKGQMADAKQIAVTANSRSPPPPRETDYQRSMREKMEIVAPGIAAKRPQQQTGVINGTARRLDGSDIYEIDADVRPRLPQSLGGS